MQLRSRCCSFSWQKRPNCDLPDVAIVDIFTTRGNTMKSMKPINTWLGIPPAEEELLAGLAVIFNLFTNASFILNVALFLTFYSSILTPGNFSQGHNSKERKSYMHEDVIAASSITAKYWRDLMPNDIGISKLQQINLIEYYAPTNTMIITIMQQNGKYHHLKRKKQNKKQTSYSSVKICFCVKTGKMNILVYT